MPTRDTTVFFTVKWYCRGLFLYKRFFRMTVVRFFERFTAIPDLKKKTAPYIPIPYWVLYNLLLLQTKTRIINDQYTMNIIISHFSDQAHI